MGSLPLSLFFFSGTLIMWLLICLMLSQNSLKLLHLLIFSSCSDWAISTTLSVKLVICSSEFSNLLLALSSVCSILVIVFWSSDWFFLIFPISLLKFSPAFFSWVWWACLWPLHWTLCLVVSYIHFVSSFLLLLLFFNVLSCSFIWNIVLCLFCLTLCVYFYVLGRLAIPLCLETVTICRRWPLGTRAWSPWLLKPDAPGVSPCEPHVPSCCGWATVSVGMLVCG